MKNPIAPFNPLHLAGSLLITAGSVVVHAAAFRASPRAALAGVALATAGALAYAFAPSLFEAPPPDPKRDERKNLARDVAAAVEMGDWQHAGELVRAAAQAHAQQTAAN